MFTPTYDEIRQSQQISYDREVQRGTVVPFAWPFSVLSYFLLIAYLQLSYYEQVRRLKYAVLLIIYALSWYSILFCRTLGLVYGLGVALVAVWPMLSGWTLLIATRPHTDFKRLVRNDRNVRHNGHGPISRAVKSSVDGGVNSTSEFYWQAMPENFWQRLFWVYDLTFSYRGPHWSWSHTTATPAMQTPQSTPHVSGRHPNFIHTSSHYATFYILIDLIKGIMLTDPYFLGLGTSMSPSWLAQESSIMHWFLLRSFRDSMTIFAIWTVLQYGTALSALVNDHFVPRGYALGDDSIPELVRPLFGPVSAVLGSGLAGFWGVFWHQTLRFAFVSNGRWAARLLGYHERSPQARHIVVITAFALSGVGHAAAAFTGWGNRDQPYRQAGKAFSFFALQIVGIYLQALLFPSIVIKDKKASQMSRKARYANIAFTLTWLWLTGPLLIDPLARGGTWLFEPLPFSFVRGLGLSSDKRWWCWKSVDWGRWAYDEKRWWLSGYQIK